MLALSRVEDRVDRNPTLQRNWPSLFWRGRHGPSRPDSSGREPSPLLSGGGEPILVLLLSLGLWALIWATFSLLAACLMR